MPGPMMPMPSFHSNDGENQRGISLSSEHHPHPQVTRPPSGYRVPLINTGTFPPPDQVGETPCIDADGSPVYIGSALFESSVHPCKIAPHLGADIVRVPYGGGERIHRGRYDLLPFISSQMEWVATSDGRIPNGRLAVEGGYEDNGDKLYHALAVVNGVSVPGKTGQHLHGCNVAFGDREHVIRNYEILCWR